MLLIVSLISAAAPMLFYLILLWWFDKYDREPIRLVLLCFLWGAVGAIILAAIASSILSIGFNLVVNDQRTSQLFEALIVAPFVEEITKGIFLLVIIFNKKFDNLTDGLVYGGAIGLGFGMTENFLYFISYGDTVQNLIFLIVIRSLFSAVMHCLSTASVGAFLSLTKFSHSGGYRWLYPFIGLLTAMFMHFVWNFTVSFEMTAISGLFFIGVSVLFFIVVYSTSLRNEKRIIIRELTDEINQNHIPAWSIELFEKNHHISDENIRRNFKHLQRNFTSLAFRKSQLKFCSIRNRGYYEQEIQNYRLAIQNLCSNT